MSNNSSHHKIWDINEFVNTIYDTRYALSNYSSARLKLERSEKKIEELKSAALDNLKKLAQEKVELTNDYDDSVVFSDLSISDKKKIIKKRISNQIDVELRQYLKEKESFDYSRAYDDFYNWLTEKNKIKE